MDCEKLAGALLFKAGVGLSAWPWYRAARPRMVAELGVDTMMHEARQELERLLAAEVPVHDAFHRTEAFLRGLWRNEYDASKAGYRPPMLPLTIDPTHEAVFVHAEEAGAEAVLREALTESEFEQVEAYADCGSLREAADRAGVSHTSVRRALLKARRAVEHAGVPL